MLGRREYTMAELTPIEIHEYKLKWLPGFSVRLHSDMVDEGKKWCRRNLQRSDWSMSSWTAVYEHTFHFENVLNAQNFEIAMGRFANQ